MECTETLVKLLVNDSFTATMKCLNLSLLQKVSFSESGLKGETKINFDSIKDSY